MFTSTQTKRSKGASLCCPSAMRIRCKLQRPRCHGTSTCRWKQPFKWRPVWAVWVILAQINVRRFIFKSKYPGILIKLSSFLKVARLILPVAFYQSSVNTKNWSQLRALRCAGTTDTSNLGSASAQVEIPQGNNASKASSFSFCKTLTTDSNWRHERSRPNRCHKMSGIPVFIIIIKRRAGGKYHGREFKYTDYTDCAFMREPCTWEVLETAVSLNPLTVSVL